MTSTTIEEVIRRMLMRNVATTMGGVLTTLMTAIFIMTANLVCTKGPETKKPASSSTSKQAATAPAQQPSAHPQTVQAPAVPVIKFAFVIAFSTHAVVTLFKKVTVFEKWERRISGIVFIIAGVYILLTQIVRLGMRL